MKSIILCMALAVVLFAGCSPNSENKSQSADVPLASDAPVDIGMSTEDVLTLARSVVAYATYRSDSCDLSVPRLPVTELKREFIPLQRVYAEAYSTLYPFSGASAEADTGEYVPPTEEEKAANLRLALIDFLGQYTELGGFVRDEYIGELTQEQQLIARGLTDEQLYDYLTELGVSVVYRWIDRTLAERAYLDNLPTIGDVGEGVEISVEDIPADLPAEPELPVETEPPSETAQPAPQILYNNLTHRPLEEGESELLTRPREVIVAEMDAWVRAQIANGDIADGVVQKLEGEPVWGVWSDTLVSDSNGYAVVRVFGVYERIKVREPIPTVEELLADASYDMTLSSWSLYESGRFVAEFVGVADTADGTIERRYVLELRFGEDGFDGAPRVVSAKFV